MEQPSPPQKFDSTIFNMIPRWGRGGWGILHPQRLMYEEPDTESENSELLNRIYLRDKLGQRLISVLLNTSISVKHNVNSRGDILAKITFDILSDDTLRCFSFIASINQEQV